MSGWNICRLGYVFFRGRFVLIRNRTAHFGNWGLISGLGIKKSAVEMQNNEAQVEDNSNACRAFLPQRALPYMWSLWVQQVKGQNVFNFQSCSI